MKNIICKFRKYTAILALSVSTALFLSESLFAQGAVVAYADGGTWIGKPQYPYYTTFPADAQLDRLTHLIASDIGCETDANNSYTGLWVGKLPNSWEGNISIQQTWNRTARNLWLQSTVSRAHAKGVKVSICVGGGEDKHFRTATNSANLQSFVNDIVSFVNLHGFDGVDMDWEWPGRYTYDANEWNQCYNLLNALKSSLPGKRISIALAGYPNNSRYNNTTALNQIWNKVDAMYLMTYDEGSWPTHSDFDGAKNLINGWANYGINWGTPKDKLFLACAFYGYKSNTLTNANKVSYSDYVAGVAPWVNRGDLLADVTAKTNHCYGNGYGGVFVWELGYDVAATGTNPPSLLNAIWAARSTISGPTTVCYSGNTFTLNNAPSGTITWSVTGPFTVSGSGATATATRIGTSTGSGTLTASFNGTTVATKTIMPCILTISGPALVCYSGSTFTLDPAPSGTITWSVTGSFTVTGNGATATVTKTGTSNSEGTLTAKINGTVVATKTITPCVAEIIGPDAVDYQGAVFSLNYNPSGKIALYISGPFFAYPLSDNPPAATIYRYGMNNTYTSGMLTIYEDDRVIAQKAIVPCPPVQISGPDVVCYSGNIFTFPVPTGATWQASPNLAIYGSGSSVNVSVQTAGLGWVSVHHKGYEVAKKYVWCGPADIESISGPAQVSRFGYGDYSVVEGQSQFFSNAVRYLWRLVVVGSGMVYEHSTTSNAPVRLYFDSEGAYKVYCQITNECGISEWFDCDVLCKKPSQWSLHAIYPNPVSGILTVEINADVDASSRSKTVSGYDVRLYDGKGNLMRQQKVKGGSLEFNVQNLPAGLYYLHIYDGVSNIPETHQIIVE